MKHTAPDAFITREILGFIRDERPTPEALAERFGEACLHLLRKAVVIVEEDGRLRLDRRRLAPEGEWFVWKNRLIHLNSDRVDLVRWGPGGPPSFGEAP
ncbi:hypothetical protein [Singulisphaera sp. PoT]|uniref:hypothetical protein n=1 Tax=Singulisphaera sp. PoT TaxID=3411797 RepID=UPI003BF5EB2B